MSPRTERLRGSAVAAVVLIAAVGAGAAIADGSLSIDLRESDPGAETVHGIELATADESPHEGNRLAGIGVRYVDSETNLEELDASDVTVLVRGERVAVDEVERNDDMLEIYADDGPTLEGGDEIAVEIDGIENPDAGTHVLEVRLVSVEASDGLLGGALDGLFELVEALLGGSSDDDGERTTESAEYRIGSPDDGDGDAGNGDDSGDGNESDGGDGIDDGGGDGSDDGNGGGGDGGSDGTGDDSDDGSDTSPDGSDGIDDGDETDGSGGETDGDADDGRDESGGDADDGRGENDGDGGTAGDGEDGTAEDDDRNDDGETAAAGDDVHGDGGETENRTIDASIGADGWSSSDTDGRTERAADDGDGGDGDDTSGSTLSRLVDVMAGLTVVVWAVMLGLLVRRP